MPANPDPAERLKIAGHGPPAKDAPEADPLKPITLILAWHPPLRRAEVIRTINTNYFLPGQFLPEDEVTLLNSLKSDGTSRYRHWTVDMTQFDVIAFIGKLAGIFPIHIG